MKLILNQEHLGRALAEGIARTRHRLLIATADVKNLRLPTARGGAESIVAIFRRLAKRHVEIQLLHGGIPSGSFLEELKRGMPATLTMRRCPRMHVKALVIDGRAMYLGSANLTGAGLGAKSATRRNFEAGIWTEETATIDPVVDMLMSVWEGAACKTCGRKAHCPVPLEEPALGF